MTEAVSQVAHSASRRGKRQRLSEEEVRSALPAGWSGGAERISREFTFRSYQAGMDFAVQVAHLAEQSDHHPELLIGYRRVKVTYWTHDRGGVTALDLASAEVVNRL